MNGTNSHSTTYITYEGKKVILLKILKETVKLTLRRP